MKKGINNQGEKQFERLLGLYLKQSSLSRDESFAKHLDEDSLAAFVEGRLTKRNDSPIISHLVQCSPCRRSTFELLQLAEQLDEKLEVVANAPVESNMFHEFWSNLKTKVFNSGDNAVFAHQELHETEDKLNDKNDNSLS